MKRIGLLLLLLSSLCLLLAQAKIDNITYNGENLIVTRIVISLSQKAVWSTQTDLDNHVVNVQIRNCDGSNAKIEQQINSSLVKNVSAESKGKYAVVTIAANGPFYVETMEMKSPFKIVVDLFEFKRTYTYQEQLAQATFYEKVGKWNTAGKQYAKMRRDFPYEIDVNYLWAKLLLKQNNYDKAKDKLEAVSSDSDHYKDAQYLLTKLKQKNFTVIQEQIADKPDSEVYVPPIAPRPKPTSIVVPRTTFQSIMKDTEKTVNIKLAEVPVWGWFILLLVVLIAIFILLDFLRHHKQQTESKPGQKVSLLLDDSIKTDMIMKLLDSGWNEKQIARELLISPKEVKRFTKKPKKISLDDDN